MKKIKLTCNRYTIVDDEDFKFLNQWKWQYHTRYVNRTAYLGGGRKNAKHKFMTLHRVLMESYGYDLTGKEIDHINGNRLDNRKINLRIATRSQNTRNSFMNRNNLSGYKGVTLHRKGKWKAKIQFNKKGIYLGLYDTPEEAAIAYNKAAKEYFGEFAKLNRCEIGGE